MPRMYADDERVVAQPVAEDRQPGREVRRDRGDGDDGHAVADLEAASGGEEREDRCRDDDHAPRADEADRPAVEIARERLDRHD